MLFEDRGDEAGVMHFSEQIEVPVAASEAWSFVWQIEQVAACLPGCVGVTEIEAGRRYRARIEDQVGPYRMGFDLDVQVEDVAPPHRIRLVASGTDKMLGVSQQIAMNVEVQELAPIRTGISVEADVEVGGTIARLGQFVIRRKAGSIVRDFVRNVAAELRASRARTDRA